MNKQARALTTLRATGCRLTPQRLLILSAIAEGGGHMGVDEVFRKTKSAYPYIDMATVYRTLHLFKQLGVVTEVAMGDRLHFELTDPDRRHHHMVCRVCGGAFDLSPQYLEEFQRTLMQEFGFEPDLDHFAISGRCAACLQRVAESTGRPAGAGR